MIPNIFISSTIKDLFYLRDAIRDTIYELGYNPIMSEYGDIGYSSPSYSAEDSCYVTMKSCQLAIFIIGSNYGSIGSGGLSVTHNEYKTAKEHHLPLIFLVHDKVMSAKGFYDKNEENADKLNFDGMDRPIETFKFLNEFIASPTNNGFIVYHNISDARLSLKKQLAHLFGELLTKIHNPVAEDIRTILSEIRTLSHTLIKDKGELANAKQYSQVLKFFSTNNNTIFSRLIEATCGNLDDSIDEMLRHVSLSDFFNAYNVEVEINDQLTLELLSNKKATEAYKFNLNVSVEIDDPGEYNIEEIFTVGPDPDVLYVKINALANKGKLVINKAGFVYFSDVFSSFKDFMSKSI
jgi:hypothetical protein